MEKINEIKLPEGVNRVAVKQHDDRIVIEFIPEEPKYKDGDFLHSDWGDENITIIYREKNGNGFYYHVSKSNTIGFGFDRYSYWPNDIDFRLATESEKKELIDALTGVGKRWNAEKKCIEYIPKRKFKAGDKVKIKDGISSETHRHIFPHFTELMDEFIGKELTVKEYNGGGWVVFYEDDREYNFAEDWLEPYEELKEGDLAIFWDYDKGGAIISLYDKKGHRYHYDSRGIYWKNAIKFESKEQFEKVLRGEI